MKFIIIILVSLFAFSLQIYADSSKIDSLLNVLKLQKKDTNKIATFKSISLEYKNSNPSQAKLYLEKALILIDSLLFENEDIIFVKKLKSQKINIFSLLGQNSDNFGDFNAEIIWQEKALNLATEINDKYGIASALSNIGAANLRLGNYDISIHKFIESLQILEQVNDKQLIASNYGNLGILYAYQGNFDKSLEYFFETLDILKVLKNKERIATCLNGIANVYYYKQDFPKCIDYYNQSLKISQEIGDKVAESMTLNNLGSIYNESKDNEKALKYYEQSYKISEEIGDKSNMAMTLINSSEIYMYDGQYDKSLFQINLGLKIAEEIKSKELIKVCYDILSELNSLQGKYKDAYENARLFIQYKDTLADDEKTKQISELQAKFDTEKKEKELKISKLELESQLSQNQMQRILIYSFIVVLLIIIIFTIFILRMFIQKRKANFRLSVYNKKILLQKDTIEEQQKEITDSIKYAEQIQGAVLTPEIIFQENFADYFILFKPRNIVSGDFYWAKKLVSKQLSVNSNQLISDDTDNAESLIIAVADCTGHGVPGAFMSMLGIAFLNEISNGLNFSDKIIASEILDKLREMVINSLNQTGQEEETYDGMDMSLVVITSQVQSSKSQAPSSKTCPEFSSGFQAPSEESEQDSVNSNQSNQTNQSKISGSDIFQAQWSGANNPLWIVRTVTQSSGLLSYEPEVRDTDSPNFRNLENLEEIKPDKMPIGQFFGTQREFKNHTFNLHSGDIIYLFSDGYADQFGGEKGGKFKYSNLKELLLKNCNLEMYKQKTELEENFNNWKAEYPQLDDICILGFKI